MRGQRAPWWRRRLGGWGVLCAVLVVASVALGFVASTGVQLGVLAGAATAYLIGLVRSPD